jgi:hypothetical protein
MGTVRVVQDDNGDCAQLYFGNSEQVVRCVAVEPLHL